MHDSRADEETRNIEGRQSGSNVLGTRPLDRSIIDYVISSTRLYGKRGSASARGIHPCARRTTLTRNIRALRAGTRAAIGHSPPRAPHASRAPRLLSYARTRARTHTRVRMHTDGGPWVRARARALAVAGATRILDACTYLLARRQDSTYNGIAGSFSGGAHTHARIPREPRIAIVCRSAAQVARRYLPEEVNLGDARRDVINRRFDLCAC